MKKIKNWFKRQIARIMFSVSNVEKNALGQSGETLDTDLSKHQRLNQGKISDSLINGEITEEVENLRWRTYKILKACENSVTDIIGYDEDDMPITKTTLKDKSNLKKISVDGFDDYELEMVVFNTNLTINTAIMMGNEHITPIDVKSKNYTTNSHGLISSELLDATEKNEYQININRKEHTNFFIENFSKKLNIRKISETEKLLEFYVSVYPDEYNRTSRLFISAIKKVLNGKKEVFLEFDSVEFITDKTIGSDNNLHYKYNNIVFDKIVEFDGHYVIKFKSDVEINGKDIFEHYKVESLDKKYENKEKK